MVSRRQFLAATGVSVVGLAGCQTQDGESSETATVGGTTPSVQPRDRTATLDLSDRFDTIHNVVEEGIDPNGDEVVDASLENLIDDDTLLRFPPGTYPIHNLSVDGVSNLGLVGRDATLQLRTQGRTVYLSLTRVSDILVDGLTIDNTATNVAAWCDLKCIGGTNVVRNYTVEGFVDVNERTNGFTIMVEGADTSLELDNVDISQGGVNGAAAFVFPRIEFYNPGRKPGSLTFRNCRMSGWGKEGLYASAHSGPLRVIGGEYANNAIAQVRVGGGNAPERAVVRDVTVRVDAIPDYMPSGNRILRGIWLKEGDGAVVENCDVTLANLGIDHTQAAIVINHQFGRAAIRDCTVTVDGVSRPAIIAERPVDEYRPDRMRALDRLPGAWNVTIAGVTVDGNSPNSESIRIEGRTGCTLEDVTIDTSGQASDGLVLDGVEGCSFDAGTITTGRFPVMMRFAGGGDCALELSDVSLRGTDLQQVGSALPGDGDGSYCIGGDVLPDARNTGGKHFTLTKTDTSAPAAESEENPTAAGGYRVYGRWIPA